MLRKLLFTPATKFRLLLAACYVSMIRKIAFHHCCLTPCCLKSLPLDFMLFFKLLAAFIALAQLMKCTILCLNYLNSKRHTLSNSYLIHLSSHSTFSDFYFRHLERSYPIFSIFKELHRCYPFAFKSLLITKKIFV